MNTNSDESPKGSHEMQPQTEFFTDPRPEAVLRDGTTWSERDLREVFDWLFTPNFVGEGKQRKMISNNYARLFERAASSIGLNEVNVENAIQEFALKLFKKHGTFEVAKGRFEQWFFGYIFEYDKLTIWRKAKRLSKREEPLDAPSEDRSKESKKRETDEALERHQEEKAIAVAGMDSEARGGLLDSYIDRLSAENAQAIRLRFYEDKSEQEIVEIQSRTFDVVHMALYRSLRRIAAWMKEDGYDLSDFI